MKQLREGTVVRDRRTGLHAVVNADGDLLFAGGRLVISRQVAQRKHYTVIK